MNTTYFDHIISLIEKKGLQYEILSRLNITEFSDYHVLFILIESKILYVIAIGEASGEKSRLYFKNLLLAAQLNKGQKLIFITDSTHLDSLPASARVEFNYFNLSFRKHWSKVLFIYQGAAKTTLDMYEIQKPEHVAGIEKVLEPNLALDYAMTGRRTADSTDEYLEALSKEQLIAEVRKLRKQQDNPNVAIDDDIKELFEKIVRVTLREEGSDVIKFNEGDVFGSIYGALNTVIGDFNEMSTELRDLKSKFDETLQSQLNQRLHQEASLRSIFDSLDSIVWMVDCDFNLMAFNNNFYHHVKSQYGFIPEVGMNAKTDMALGSTYDKTLERITKALDGKEENYRDFYKENEEIKMVVDSKIFPVIVDNEISGVACLTTDVTESYHTEQHVKEREHIIASVNKNISEAIYRSSHKKGLIFVNEAFVKMFGFETKEELYQHVELNGIYANNKDRERLGQMLIKNRKMTNYEVRFRRKNGELFTGLLSCMVSVDGEGETHFDGAIRDVTAIKKVQEKLEFQNSELKKLNTELDSFVYSASHDLKAPLSSIKGLLSLAKKEEDREKLANYLELTEKSINKLDVFINDIIDLSRNARQDVQKDLIDFDELIQDTLDNYQYLANFDKIEKIINIESDIPFYSDKRRIKVILNNLISNSIRYYNPRIENPHIKVEIKADKKNVVIRSSDNGLGIESKYLEKIFEMFFRASNHSQGTGIGLYIVKETVQKVNGKIKVESTIEKGTMFEVTLPNLKA